MLAQIVRVGCCGSIGPAKRWTHKVYVYYTIYIYIVHRTQQREQRNMLRTCCVQIEVHFVQKRNTSPPRHATIKANTPSRRYADGSCVRRHEVHTREQESHWTAKTSCVLWLPWVPGNIIAFKCIPACERSMLNGVDINRRLCFADDIEHHLLETFIYRYRQFYDSIMMYIVSNFLNAQLHFQQLPNLVQTPAHSTSLCHLSACATSAHECETLFKGNARTHHVYHFLITTFTDMFRSAGVKKTLDYLHCALMLLGIMCHSSASDFECHWECARSGMSMSVSIFVTWWCPMSVSSDSHYILLSVYDMRSTRSSHKAEQMCHMPGKQDETEKNTLKTPLHTHKRTKLQSHLWLCPMPAHRLSHLNNAQPWCRVTFWLPSYNIAVSRLHKHTPKSLLVSEPANGWCCKIIMKAAHFAVSEGAKRRMYFGTTDIMIWTNTRGAPILYAQRNPSCARTHGLATWEFPRRSTRQMWRILILWNTDM